MEEGGRSMRSDVGGAAAGSRTACRWCRAGGNAAGVRAGLRDDAGQRGRQNRAGGLPAASGKRGANLAVLSRCFCRVGAPGPCMGSPARRRPMRRAWGLAVAAAIGVVGGGWSRPVYGIGSAGSCAGLPRARQRRACTVRRKRRGRKGPRSRAMRKTPSEWRRQISQQNLVRSRKPTMEAVTGKVPVAAPATSATGCSRR